MRTLALWAKPVPGGLAARGRVIADRPLLETILKGLDAVVADSKE